MTSFPNRRRHWPLQIASVTVMTLVLVLMNLTFLGASVFDAAVAAWGRGLQMQVYLEPAADAVAVADLVARARASGQFREVAFDGARDATRKFLNQLGGGAARLLDDPEWRSPIPATLALTLDDAIDPRRRLSTLREWADVFRASGLVGDVFYGQGWIENFSSFVAAARASFAGLWVLVSVVGLLIVGNCIRLSFHQRRDEVELLELLGATPRFIRRPFVGEGLALGLVASVTSLTISTALHAGLVDRIVRLGEPFASLGHVGPMSTWTVFFNLVSGLGFGGLGAWLCVRRLNTGWSANS